MISGLIRPCVPTLVTGSGKVMLARSATARPAGRIERMRLPILTSVWVTLALTGCTVPGNPPAALVTEGARVAPQTVSTAPISPARALALFDAVCGASLPGFAQAPALMAANGITVPSPSGTATVYSATEDVSFQVQDGPGAGRTCSMVFGTIQTAEAAATTFAAIGQFVETPLGLGTIYRGTNAVVLIGGNATQGPTTYLNLRLLSER